MTSQYAIQRRTELSLSEFGRTPKWDVFLSAYNSSSRVTDVFAAANADQKHWLLHNEYQYKAFEFPAADVVFTSPEQSESAFIASYFSEVNEVLDPTISLCVDVTGFMRPHLLFLVRMLHARGFSSVDFVYTDPVKYVDEENTTFTDGPVVEVRQVAGFEGIHVPENTSKDILIIGAGYDHELIHRVCLAKEHARKRLLFGLPSLQPDMYQESRVRAARANESLGPDAEARFLFAPANNPFVTAEVVSEFVSQYREREGQAANVYLCPVGTKPQVLGFGLYYIRECIDAPTSILFPIAERYSRETTTGVARVWKYTVEF